MKQVFLKLELSPPSQELSTTWLDDGDDQMLEWKRRDASKRVTCWRKPSPVLPLSSPPSSSGARLIHCQPNTLWRIWACPCPLWAPPFDALISASVLFLRPSHLHYSPKRRGAACPRLIASWRRRVGGCTGSNSSVSACVTLRGGFMPGDSRKKVVVSRLGMWTLDSGDTNRTFTVLNLW